ncbi:MAG: hypothetical protein IPK85_03190 [Gemmatimonadetes bacterium]|nr:hypothetical protein [Gemmatimonadota bacterium]
MADNLMKVHQIEEAALRARNVARGIGEAKRHEVTDEEIEWVDSFDEFLPTHRNVAALLANLAGVEIVFKSAPRAPSTPSGTRRHRLLKDAVDWDLPRVQRTAVPQAEP